MTNGTYIISLDRRLTISSVSDSHHLFPSSFPHSTFSHHLSLSSFPQSTFSHFPSLWFIFLLENTKTERRIQSRDCGAHAWIFVLNSSWFLFAGLDRVALEQIQKGRLRAENWNDPLTSWATEALLSRKNDLTNRNPLE